jgi:hypothetical protein
MPVFIIAGHQRSLARQVKIAVEQAVERFGNWTFLLQPSHASKQAGINSKQVIELLNLAGENEGAHIFGIDASKDRQAVADRISPHFRFRWLPAHLAADAGRGLVSPLQDSLVEALAEETLWLNNVKPRDSASPLILPKIFEPQRDLREIWRLSESYNNPGHLQKATELIERFIKEHRFRGASGGNAPWLGSDGWFWDDDGPRHGQPSFPGDWKYSLRLPDGFHYDVSSKTKNKTHFADRHGCRHPLPPKKYFNVTAHGELRGKGEES